MTMDTGPGGGHPHPDAVPPITTEAVCLACGDRSTDVDVETGRCGGCEAVWPEHGNDIGDWCPHSGRAKAGGDNRCPAGCRQSDPDADQDDDFEETP